MTISSTTSRITATGTGSTETYPYTFKIFDDDELEVKVKLLSTQVETTLTKTTDYTVTGVGVAAGGNVVLVDADQAWLDASGFLLSTYSITIRRVMEFTQLTSITSQSSYLPELHEKEFDRRTMTELELRDEVNRALQLPTTEAGTSANTTIADATTRANKLLSFDSSGNPTTTAFVTAANSAPVSSAFVTIGTDATLTNERSLTGTADQINVTDNGAGSTVVLSTPQSINTTSSPTFVTLTASTSVVTPTLDRGTSGAVTVAANITSIVPSAHQGFSLGSSAAQLGSVNSTAYNLYSIAGDTFPATKLSTPSNGLQFGPGGSTAPETALARSTSEGAGFPMLILSGTLTGSPTSLGAVAIRINLVSQTVTRLSYLKCMQPNDNGGTATITGGSLAWFDAAAGTHKAVDGSSTKSSPSAVDAWIKWDINGTVYYTPAYTSKTS